MKRMYGLVFACSLLCFLVGNAFAGITVIPNLINLTSTDLPRTDVSVTNDGDEDAYVKVSPYAILEPGTKNERKILIRNPLQYGLLVSPQQFIIPPKQHRQVRFMLTEPCNSKERIYRIEIVPIAKDIIPLHSKTIQGKKLGLQIMVGYGVLAMVRPTNPKLNIVMHRTGNQLILTNKGNANIELSNIEQCIKNTCHPVSNFIRLYSGNSNHITLKFSSPVKMVAQLLDEQKILISD